MKNLENRKFNAMKKIVLRDLLDSPNSAKRISERVKEEVHNTHNVLKRLLDQRSVKRERVRRLTPDGKMRYVHVYQITAQGVLRLERYESLGL